MSITRVTLFATFAAASAGLYIPPALAQETTTSVAVSYADLNIASSEGKAALARRINRAIDDVCGEVDTHELAMTNKVLACRSKAQGSVDVQLAQIDRGGPQLALALLIPSRGR
jgi:UrcA family protein